MFIIYKLIIKNKKNIQVIGFNDGGFNVVGKNEIQGVNGVVSGYDTPSDHFGVVVKYAIKSNTKKIPSTSLGNNNGNSNNDNNNNSNALLNIEELRAKRLAALTGNKNDNKNEGSGNNNVDQHTTLKKNTNVRNNDVKSDDVIDFTDD